MPLQELIHKYEVGAGYRYLTRAVALLALAGVALFYNLAAFRNLSTREGMDAAQLARNLSEGHGFTTEFIRPLSIHLLRKHHAREQVANAKTASAETNALPPFQLPARHPDLANAPLYPLLLAAALKAMPFDFPDLATTTNAKIYLPDLWIAGVNQFLFLVAVILVFRLAVRLFDEPVAWLTAAVLAGTELFWRISLAGFPSMLLLVIFTALASVLVSADATAREPGATSGRLIWLAVLAGLLTGLGGMTRYAYGWLMVPVAGFLALLPGTARVRLAVVAVLSFAVVSGPWIYRNWVVSGTPFGTAGYAIFSNTGLFAAHELERTLSPHFTLLRTVDFWNKLVHGGREILTGELFKLGGNWVTAMFFVGLLVPFRSATLGRLRWFLISCMAVLGIAQALGSSSVPADPRETPLGLGVNADDLLIVLAPLVFLFGISLLFNLLEQFTMPAARFWIIGIFYLLVCSPLLFVFFSQKPSPIAYPPYYPPWIQAKTRWINHQEWVAADLPWAVAWYGHRQAVWLPLKYRSPQGPREDFFALDSIRPVKGLYLTAATVKAIDANSLVEWRETEVQDQDWERLQKLLNALGSRMMQSKERDMEVAALKEVFELVQEHWVRGGGSGWEDFVLGVYVNQEVPTGFPLRHAPEGLYPEIFLTDSERVAEKTIQSSEQAQVP